MQKKLLATVGLWILGILFLLNLAVTVLEPQTAYAKKDTDPVGRYQITSWALSTGGMSHYTGYYVLDTATGKIIDKFSELHKQDAYEAPQN